MKAVRSAGYSENEGDEPCVSWRPHTPLATLYFPSCSNVYTLSFCQLLLGPEQWQCEQVEPVLFCWLTLYQLKVDKIRISFLFFPQVFEAMITWIKHDKEARLEHMPKLMEHVRLPLLSRDYLVQVVYGLLKLGFHFVLTFYFSTNFFHLFFLLELLVLLLCLCI